MSPKKSNLYILSGVSNGNSVNKKNESNRNTLISQNIKKLNYKSQL